MKLATRYHRVNIFTTLIILLFTGVIYYVVIHFILTTQLDKDLALEENEILTYTKAYQKLPLTGNYTDQKIVFKLIANKRLIKRTFIYSNYFNAKENETEPGRALITAINFKGNVYQITITKSTVEADDLIRIIFLVTLGVTVLLLISLLLVNRLLLQRLWQPFYIILAQIKNFNITNKEDVFAPDTKIDEFTELNQAAKVMFARVKQDYKELKNFTDNASHEMMTPLAVINLKLDTLLQTATFSNKQGEIIEDIYTAIGRLAKLNQALLLLAKIENNLIIDQEKIDLKDIISRKLRQFKELFLAKELTLNVQLAAKEVVMSKFLLDVLLNNLLSNAIKHNLNKGSITINLTPEKLIIGNNGVKEPLAAVKSFERFYKTPSSDGMGLGLAISKEICSLQHFNLSYSYNDEKHFFTLVF